MSPTLEERVAALEDTVGELLSALAEDPPAEPEDRLAAGFARFMARGKTEAQDAEGHS